MRSASALLLALLLPGAKHGAVPPQVQSAKTLWLVNKTNDKNLGPAASDEFAKWHHFAPAPSRDAADFTAVFTHHWGMDLLGNTSFVTMEVFAKDQTAPLYKTENAVYLLNDPEHRARVCIHEFEQWVDAAP